MSSQHAVRAKALDDLRRSNVLLVDGHFDYGNGYHGEVYLNSHQLFREPSLIWRLAQDLIDLIPSSLIEQTEVVAGPVTGGALLAHTIAGLLDGRRSLNKPPCQFSPFTVDPAAGLTLRQTYAGTLAGKRVLIADDVRNVGKTFERCAALVTEAGGTVLGTVQIVDRLECLVDLGVPNVALTEFQAPPNWPTDSCPALRCRRADHHLLREPAWPWVAGTPVPLFRSVKRARRSTVCTKDYDDPASADDPVHLVRRYSAPDDVEIAGFCAAGLAFGRVASVLTSVTALLDVMGDSPSEFVRAFGSGRGVAAVRRLGHRWITGDDLVALVWILRHMLDDAGSIEAFFLRGYRADAEDVGGALDDFCARGACCAPRTSVAGSSPSEPGRVLLSSAE